MTGFSPVPFGPGLALTRTHTRAALSHSMRMSTPNTTLYFSQSPQADIQTHRISGWNVSVTGFLLQRPADCIYYFFCKKKWGLTSPGEAASCNGFHFGYQRMRLVSSLSLLASSSFVKRSAKLVPVSSQAIRHTPAACASRTL